MTDRFLPSLGSIHRFASRLKNVQRWMKESHAQKEGSPSQKKKRREKKQKNKKKEESALFHLWQLNTRSETSTAFVSRIFIARLSTCSTNVCYPMPARVSLFARWYCTFGKAVRVLKKRIIFADLSRGWRPPTKNRASDSRSLSDWEMKRC